MAVPKTQTIGVGMVEHKRDRAYKDYARIPTLMYVSYYA